MSVNIVNTNSAATHLSESGDRETWQSVVDQLDEKPRTIVLDQRGWGNSVATDGRCDLTAIADNIEAVAHTFGLERYALVDHLMSGELVQIVAARSLEGHSLTPNYSPVHVRR
jgi:pimeloyl-ACP methyl ester carboxylesterase